MAGNVPDFSVEAPTGSTYVLTAPVSNSEKELYKVAVAAISNQEFENIIWICYQKVPKDVIEYLNDCGADSESINKIHFIDMLSYSIGLTQHHENTSYCQSPTEYICLMRSIGQLELPQRGRLIIFDNLNALMSYDIFERIIRFIRNLNNLAASNSDSILYLGISGGSSQEIEVSIETAMDNIYYLQKKPVRSQQANAWDQFKETSWTDVFTLNAPLLFILLMVMIVSNITLLAVLIYLVLS